MAAPAPAPGAADLIIEARTVVTPRGLLRDGAVHITDGIISLVVGEHDGMDPFPEAEQRPLPDAGAASAFDILVPGFVDMQVNGIGAFDVAGACGEDWSRLDTLLLSQGVVAWCPTITSAPLDEMAAAHEAIKVAARRPDNPSQPRPNVAGAHIEGPYLTSAGAHVPEHLRRTVDLPAYLDICDGAAIVTLAPDVAGAPDAIAALANQGTVVSAGHSLCTAEEAARAFDAGARLTTHLGNAMTGIHHRDIGLAGAALLDDRVTVCVIADLAHTSAGFIRLAYRLKGPDHFVGVTDAVAADAGTAGAIRVATVSSDPRDPPVRTPVRSPATTAGCAGPEGPAVRPTTTGRHPVPLTAEGRLAGSVLTMPRALANLARECDIGLAAAARALSSVPARILGLEANGDIREGYRADLVALSAEDLSVEAVFIGGRPAYGPTRD